MIYLRKCVICGNETSSEDNFAKYILNLEKEKILVCKACDLRWLYPFMSDDEYKNFYSQGYFDELYSGETFDKRLSAISDEFYFKRRIRNIIKIKQRRKASILDVGCGYGLFIRCAKDLGLNPVGIDISEYVISKVRAKYDDLNVVACSFFDFHTETKFDVIHMNHVFEHFTDPVRALSKIKSLLNQGGLLVMEIPNQFKNIYDILRYIIKVPVQSKFFSLQHPFFWSEKSIKKFLSDNGFEILKVKVYDRKDFWIRKPGDFDGFIFRVVKLPVALLAYILGRGANIEIFAELK